MIKLINLNKYYNKGQRNECHVINNISYTFEDKGLYTFFGPSGCGKTTLLNVIGCLDSFDSGSIVFDNVSFEKYKSSTADELRNELISYVFQNYNLIDSKTVYENIEIVLEMIGVTDKKEKNERILNCLKAVGLYKHRRRNVLALSGGERQRVAIARALVKNPKVILADEPTGNLDSNNTFEVMNIIKNISKEKLVILVSHEKNLVDYYADRIIELKDGVIVHDYENNSTKDLLHSDTRNIYLNDYIKREIKDDNINVDVYSNGETEEISLEIVYKNGEVYIKPTSTLKVHLIDDNTEVKFLNISESEFRKKQETKEPLFSYDSFNDYNENPTNKKGYISLFSSIKSGLKTKGYIKRSVFTKLVLIFTGILFAFFFTSISEVFNFKKTDYIKTPKGVVRVDLSYRDEKKGYSIYDVVDDAKNIEGFLSVVTAEEFAGHYIYVNLNRFYQTSLYSSSVSSSIYLEKCDNKNYEVLYGEKVENDYEVVISNVLAETLLKNSNAKLNAYNEPKELIGVFCSFESSYLNDSFNYKIVGISNEESPTCYVNDKSYVEKDFGYSNSIYISSTNEQLVLNTLKEKYSKVYDARDNARSSYIKDRLNDKMPSLILISIMTIALFVYLSFMIRSSLFGRIKDVGILRSIGATKKDINSIFMGDIIALTVKTSFISYTITYLVMVVISYLYDFESYGIKLFNANLITYFIGLFIICGINMLATLIPISALTLKTPVEIIKKYDI